MKRKNKHIGSTLDEFLMEQGTFEAFQARAIKEVVAGQLQQAMKRRKLSKARMAAAMGTSRTQIDRLLNPNDGNVTLATLQRAALVVGRKVHLELV
jgi:hypothetical protein